jgi:hypothetical protein
MRAPAAQSTGGVPVPLDASDGSLTRFWARAYTETESGGVAVIEMTIESIRVSLMNYQRVVILKE